MFSSRDEKAAEEKKRLEEMAKKEAVARAKAENEAKEKELEEMKRKADVASARARIEANRLEAEAKSTLDQAGKAVAQAVDAMGQNIAAAGSQVASDAAAMFKRPEYTIIKEHTLTPEDTLSALALHFYGHATPDYWKYIIEVNKDTIGDKVSDYTPGKKIKIAELPPELKNR